MKERQISAVDISKDYVLDDSYDQWKAKEPVPTSDITDMILSGFEPTLDQIDEQLLLAAVGDGT